MELRHVVARRPGDCRLQGPLIFVARDEDPLARPAGRRSMARTPRQQAWRMRVRFTKQRKTLERGSLGAGNASRCQPVAGGGWVLPGRPAQSQVRRLVMSGRQPPGDLAAQGLAQ